MATAIRRLTQLHGKTYCFSVQINKCSPIRLKHHAPSTIPSKFKTHDELYDYSINHPAEFWANEARNNLTWSKTFTKSMDCNMLEGRFSWFEDGTLNASVNCVDRHALENPNKVALIWEKDKVGEHEKVTYEELKDMVCRIANVFKSRGIGKRDVVVIYLPISPVAVATMLACSRIGAVHSVIFAGFSSVSITTRVQDSSAVAIVTANEGIRGGKTIPLRSTVEAATDKNACPSVRHIFVTNRTENGSSHLPGDVLLESEMQKFSNECPPEPMLADDHLFILYSSGSTGTPKGLVHSTAGYLLYAGYTQKHVFGYYDNRDVFACVADIGWITGHSYVVYGPLLNGGTSLLFESMPIFPDPSRYWDMIERHKVNQFYCAPTAVRLLLKYGDKYVGSKDLSSLKVIGSVGEPINPEAWHWLNDVVGKGKCDLVDTWWQTETGGICIAPRPSEIRAPILPSMAMRALPGINPVVLDDDGNERTELGASGYLCLKTPWPGIARTVYGSHERYMETYFSSFPGYYFTGDGAYRDHSGFLQITGRVDDVINVSGHRLGTAEIEGVLDEHDAVAESAIVGCPHDIKGESVFAYVTLKKEATEKIASNQHNQTDLVDTLKNSIKTEIAGFAVPDHIMICENLPKTRSGKIMRRILRKIAMGQYGDLGDVSTLSDPDMVEKLVTVHEKWVSGKR